MTLFAYAVCRAAEVPSTATLTGPDGSPLRFVCADNLALACAPVVQRQTPTEGVLLAYAGVIEALHAFATTLPLRHGTYFESEADIIALLDTQRKELHALLDRVQGCSEMGLRILLPPSEAAAPVSVDATPGRAYLLRRKAQYDAHEKQQGRAQQRQAELIAALAGLFVACEADPVRPPDTHLLSLHFLVRREDVARFRNAVNELPSDSGVRWVTGPWPPYHFAARSSSPGLAETVREIAPGVRASLPETR